MKSGSKSLAPADETLSVQLSVRFSWRNVSALVYRAASTFLNQPAGLLQK